MSEGKENKLILRSIDDLLKEDFFIPDYQRGYRWTPTQVEALLNDIWNFRDSSQEAKKDVFYCLQPIVVAHGDNSWIVIDGQQRLTTIHLILTYLSQMLITRERKNFGITYQTRPDSESFLNAPDLKRKNENVDYYHICEAYETIENWFKAKGGNYPINFINTLLNSDEEGKNVKVIWYEVSEAEKDNHVDVFTRLNIGKIPLTNAELIKAFFLQRGNFEEQKVSLKQIQIASEWDYIEKVLQQDEFWYFIYDPSNHLKYETRIEYIFDLIHRRTREHEYYYTFYEFVNRADEIKQELNHSSIDRLWLEIKQYFLTFEEWFNNREWFHLIGYLVACGKNIDTLKMGAIDKSKEEFKSYLFSQIKLQVNFNVDDLTYGTSKENERIRKVLLLFNIQTLTISNEADMRFPFHRYKSENWDIEHIRSQTDLGLNSKKQKIAWIRDILNYVTGTSLDSDSNIDLEGLEDEKLKEIATLLLNLLQEEEPDNEEFNTVKKEVEVYFKEDDTPEFIDGLGNLALLDERTNRSYKNALFPIKRKTIIENDMIGRFVPICTKNAFLKFYSAKLDDLMHWNASDAESYLNSIKSSLKDFLPLNTINHDELD
ncbi:MAG: DUF262 domain-containing protein [Cyclobacteriaceae bacterium]